MLENGSARREIGVVGFTVRYVAVMLAVMLAYAALTVLLVGRFPAHALWIVGCLCLLFSAGIGTSVGLDWYKPSSRPEDRRLAKRLGLFALLAVACLILFDAFKQGFDIILSVSATFAAGICGMLAGFFVGRAISRRRNAIQEHQP